MTTLSNFSYSAEGELTKMTAGSVFNCSGPSVYVYSLRGELTGLPPNCLFGKSSQTFMANGAQVRVPTPQQVGSQYAWNDLMAVMTSVNQNGQQSSWTYDAAGRMTSESEPYAQSTASPAPVTATRTYDAENHVNLTTLQTPAPQQSSYPYASVSWGPDGHPITIAATMTGGNSPNTERLHWNGDQLLFTTNNKSGSAALDDIKVDVQGDVLPQDQGYPGLTFYDRGPGGTALGCHNFKGTSYVGPSDSALGFTLAPCGGSLSPPGAPMPSSVMWNTSPYNGGGFTPGKNTLGMPRPDGFTDGFDTIQGVRAYDSTSGSWTTPDSYAGVAEDPASQKSYLWNGNDPMDNMDPSGYIEMQSPTPFAWPNSFNSDPAASNWSDYLNALFNSDGEPPKLCGNQPCVTAHRPPQQPSMTCMGPGGESEATCSGGALLASFSPWDWLKGLLSPTRPYAVQFQTAHFWPRLEGRIVSLANLEAAIVADFQARAAVDDTLPESLSSASQTFTFAYDNGGTIVTISYRAYFVPPGYVNIGTVFIP